MCCDSTLSNTLKVRISFNFHESPTSVYKTLGFGFSLKYIYLCGTFPTNNQEGASEKQSPFLLGMKKLGEKLKELIDADAANYDLFVVHHTVSPTGLFRFYLDSEEVLSMGVLTEFTRHISRTIDEGEFGEHPFTFEISSPGATEPLRDIRQFKKHIGRSLKIQTEEATFQGAFTSFENKILTIQNEVKEKGKKKINLEEVQIPFNQIKEATIILSFK